MAKITSINLIRSQQTHYIDTFLKWALTTGRFMIILTETIALSAFVYRFSLDREIIDLTDEISNNQAIVALYTDEPVYKNLQERLNHVETLIPEKSQKTDLLRDFVSLAQGNVTYQHLTIGGNEVNLEIITSSTGSLSTFLNGVKNMTMVKNVTVNNVENRAGSGIIVVGITAELNSKEKDKSHE